MVETEITQAEAEAAKTEKLCSRSAGSFYPHPWFVDHVILDEAPKYLHCPGIAELSIAEIKANYIPAVCTFITWIKEFSR